MYREHGWPDTRTVKKRSWSGRHGSIFAVANTLQVFPELVSAYKSHVLGVPVCVGPGRAPIDNGVVAVAVVAAAIQ